MNGHLLRVLALVGALLFTAYSTTGCRQSLQPTPTPSADVNIALDTNPAPPTMGEAILQVTLTDGAGAPIDGASIAVRGNMNHAGMIPYIPEPVTAGEGGVYLIPFEWTMGGDWIVTVEAVLAGGELITRTFDVSVES